MLTYVLAADGSPLMPTYNIKKVRHMLKDGRAVIAGHKPGFTIQLTYALPDQKTPHTQKVELCEDTGYQHIGVSVKSAKHEYVHMQVDTLTDEKDHHDAQRRYRRTNTPRNPDGLRRHFSIKQIFMCVLYPRSRRYCRFVMYTLKWGHSIHRSSRQRKRAFQFLKDRTISMESVTVLQRFVKRYFIVTAISAAAKESKTVGFSVYTTSATGKHRLIIQTGWAT